MTEDLQYDEDEAVKFIQNYLPTELKDKFSSDEINYVIDLIYDYYDHKGLTSEQLSEDDIIEIDEDDMTLYVLKNAKKDNIREFSSDEITFIIQGELAYCESLNIFE